MKIFKLIVFASILFSCSSSSVKNEYKLKIAKSIIDNFFKEFKEENKNYLINPYYKSFDFSNSIDHQGIINKEKLFSLKGLNDDKFNKLKNRVNKIYKGKFSEELFNISDSKRSKYVFTFSGFSRDIVFVDVLFFGIEYKREDLINNPLNLSKKPNYANQISFVVLIDKDRVKEMFLTSAIAYGL